MRQIPVEQHSIKYIARRGVLIHSVLSDTVQPHGLQPARLLCPCVFSGKNMGLGCHFLLQGNFLTQGTNMCLHLLHKQVDSLPLSHWEATQNTKPPKIHGQYSSNLKGHKQGKICFKSSQWLATHFICAYVDYLSLWNLRKMSACHFDVWSSVS